MKIFAHPKILSNQHDERPVSLGERHGYRFDGDTVHLHAMFAVHTPDAHSLSWALQLWACPAAPLPGSELVGHLVAEVTLPPIGEVADDTLAFEVATHAQTPAGRTEYVMVLALVTGEEVHDYRVYPRSERFYAPALRGAVGYRIDDARVSLSLQAIENPRPADNLSGTLAIELWALPTRYEGGAFSGFPLAGAAFDALPGQWEYRSRTFDLPFTTPPAGAWQIVAMLREWTAAGFQTRDHVNFDTPYLQSAPQAMPTASAPAVAQAPVAAPKKAVARKTTAKPVAADIDGIDFAKILKSNGISINKASVEDLAQARGMNRKLAEAIVKARPFRSLDDLLEVKGIGAKLLGKIRPGLKL
ncbi:MAG TPA: helix-hairpin-helix domain-containing protein [Chthoniobacter sp.]|nr:helix-hairpin-helix domain-containing protein [Chthoniobacter sp.]